MKKLPPIVIAIIVFVVLAFGVFIGRISKTDDMPPADASMNQAALTPSDTAVALTVEALSPEQIIAENSIDASGVIVGKDIAQVGAKVSGVAIDRVLVAVGDYVKAGQVLAILDGSSSALQGEELTAQLAQAQVSLLKATADLQRAEPLIDIDAISREQYESYKVAKMQAELSVRASEARLANSQNIQHNTQVVAPVSGIISHKNADVGMMTTGGVLFEIIQDGILEWQAGISPSDANNIQIGQIAYVDVAGREVAGVVNNVAPVANNSREIIVHTTLESSALVRGGMYQSGRFVLSNQRVNALPYTLITTSDGQDYVWTLTHKSGDLYTAHKTTVKLGTRVGDSVAVDLPEYAQVVKSGGGFLREGDTVRVVANTQPTTDLSTDTQ